MTQSCSNCRYWNKGEDPGHCQRHPPVPIKDKRLGQWPLTKGADWCGEYQAEPPPAPPVPKHLRNANLLGQYNPFDEEL